MKKLKTLLRRLFVKGSSEDQIKGDEIDSPHFDLKVFLVIYLVALFLMCVSMV